MTQTRQPLYNFRVRLTELTSGIGKRTVSLALSGLVVLTFVGGFGISPVFAVTSPSTTTLTCYTLTITLHSFPGVTPTTKCKAVVTGSYSIPTGIVGFSSDLAGKFSGTGACTLRTGACKTFFRPNAAGTATLTANYLGSGVYDPSSGSFVVTVNPAHTRTVVRCFPASVRAGSSTVVTCSARVIGFRPSGTVQFVPTGVGTVMIPTDTCTLGIHWSCSVALTGVSAGSVRITGVYTPGDSNNLGSSGIRGILVRP